MAIELRGMDGVWRNFSSIDILRRGHLSSDYQETQLQLLASIGNELEDIRELLKLELEE